MEIFISHAAEDTASVARPLALALTNRGFQVWYDEYSLTVGDSIRQQIDRGLRTCQFGIVVLSEAFFSKAWTQFELNGLIGQEVARGGKIVLPVLHGVTHAEVAEFSPILADRLAITTAGGIESVVDAIHRAVLPQLDDSEAEATLANYEILYPVHRGHFGVVLKCRSLRTGAICVVKQSERNKVSHETLEALTQIRIANLASPLRVWRTDEFVYECPGSAEM